MLTNKEKNQKGVSIFLALAVMTVLTAITLGLSVILISEIKTVRGLGNSVASFYAADSGIEAMFWQDKKCTEIDCNVNYPALNCTANCTGLLSGSATSSVLDNGARYDAEFSTTSLGESVATSTGSFEGIQRAIESYY